MKEKIGGWEFSRKIKKAIACRPDVALSDTASRKSYYWLFGEKRRSGEAPVFIYFKTVRGGIESFESAGARTKEDAVGCLKFENRMQIIQAERKMI